MLCPLFIHQSEAWKLKFREVPQRGRLLERYGPAEQGLLYSHAPAAETRSQVQVFVQHTHTLTQGEKEFS